MTETIKPIRSCPRRRLCGQKMTWAEMEAAHDLNWRRLQLGDTTCRLCFPLLYGVTTKDEMRECAERLKSEQDAESSAPDKKN